MVTVTHYLVLSFLLFAIGLVGIATRRNLITVLMSIELVLNGVNLNLVAFSHQLADLTGQVFAVFTITVAAGEAAVGLGILLALYRLHGADRSRPGRRSCAARCATSSGWCPSLPLVGAVLNGVGAARAHRPSGRSR